MTMTPDSSDTPDIQIRALDRAGIQTAIEWARREGWNPGLADIEAFSAVDPRGFLGLFRDGQLASTLSAVRYGPSFGFVGFYICEPSCRAQGLGFRLWQEALQGLDCRCVGLDGVLAQQDNYAKSGFVFAHRNVRYGGPRPAVAGADHPAIRDLGAGDTAAVSGLEARLRVFPAPREPFLTPWLSPPSQALGWEAQGVLQGYGVIRPCFEGFKIGPVFAADAAIAEAIVLALLARVPDGPVFLDVPEVHADAVALARALGLQPSFETARMYRGPDPGMDLSRVFGITSFELG